MDGKKLKEILDSHCVWLRTYHLEGEQANLTGANLRGASLGDANLRDAYLGGANLINADLRGAKNIPNTQKSLLSILKHQANKLKAFKYLNKNNVSPYKDFSYEIGKTYSLKKEECVYDEMIHCGAGFNVATLDWCLVDSLHKINDYNYIEVEFDPKDIVAIPYNTNGKFRVKKMKVLRQLTIKELQEAIKPINPKEE